MPDVPDGVFEVVEVVGTLDGSVCGLMDNSASIAWTGGPDPEVAVADAETVEVSGCSAVAPSAVPNPSGGTGAGGAAATAMCLTPGWHRPVKGSRHCDPDLAAGRRVDGPGQASPPDSFVTLPSRTEVSPRRVASRAVAAKAFGLATALSMLVTLCVAVPALAVQTFPDPFGGAGTHTDLRAGSKGEDIGDVFLLHDGPILRIRIFLDPQTASSSRTSA